MILSDLNHLVWEGGDEFGKNISAKQKTFLGNLNLNLALGVVASGSRFGKFPGLISAPRS